MSRASARWIVLLWAALAVASAHAQTQTATLRGVVTDRSGAVVVGAAVTLENVDQNRVWKFATNEAGEYVFVQIPPGRYALAAERARVIQLGLKLHF